VPGSLKWVSLCLWVSGFLLLFIGRLGLGDSFRIGSPKESTSLKLNGLFRFSRNPMYLGVYATLLASVVYTLNPILLLVGIFIVVVHHRIVLAEEQHLRKEFGQEYTDYCSRVRRYL
jgi:protein-S-isoprenylcysteine O-methyltransferase Ste14